MKKTGEDYRYNVLYSIQIFTKLGMHAAGIFRARGGYKFKRAAIGINTTTTTTTTTTTAATATTTTITTTITINNNVAIS